MLIPKSSYEILLLTYKDRPDTYSRSISRIVFQSQESLLMRKSNSSIGMIYINILKKASHSKLRAFFLFPLTILSFFFWIGITVRKLFLKKKEASLPIVTVGNISFGGTGKTPFILCLLKNLPFPVAYVSRGYGRKSKKSFVGKGSTCTYEACGDEAMQVARRFKNSLVSIAEDKWEAVQNVGKEESLILLDDGLQRYDIPKALEIATVDVQNPDGYGGLFPRGLLREPMSRLKKVDYIVLTNLPPHSDPEVFREHYSRRFCPKTIAVRQKISRFFSPEGATRDLFPGNKVALFSAIASPHRVRELMEQGGFLVVDHLVYPDHLDIEEETLYTFCENVRSSFPDAVLVGTEKDFVKKIPWPDLPLPLLFSEMDVEVVGGRDIFEELLSAIGRLRV